MLFMQKLTNFFKSTSEALMVFMRPKSFVPFQPWHDQFWSKRTQQKANYGTSDCLQLFKFLGQVLLVQNITNFFKSIFEALMVFMRPKSSVPFLALAWSISVKKTQQKTNYGTLDCLQIVKFSGQVLFVQKVTNFFKSISEALFVFMRRNWSVTY